MRRDQTQNTIEGADADGIVVGNRYALMGGDIRLQNDMAALLMNLTVAPILAKRLDDLAPGEISREFHAASTSSRTRCRRMERVSFSGWSK